MNWAPQEAGPACLWAFQQVTGTPLGLEPSSTQERVALIANASKTHYDDRLSHQKYLITTGKILNIFCKSQT